MPRRSSHDRRYYFPWMRGVAWGDQGGSRRGGDRWRGDVTIRLHEGTTRTRTLLPTLRATSSGSGYSTADQPVQRGACSVPSMPHRDRSRKPAHFPHAISKQLSCQRVYKERLGCKTKDRAELPATKTAAGLAQRLQRQVGGGCDPTRAAAGRAFELGVARWRGFVAERSGT